MFPRIAPRSVLLIGSLAWTAQANNAHAHPGHGTDTTGVGLVHFLLEPSHGGAAALLAVVVLGIVVFARVYGHRQG